ncbi:EAL domain-containing protein [Myxosarcina sp. GI1]|uniref:EAL domain-containing protein n=1 Tax=Myxosarcina sp. GI1 TaxID=1541065 RepID=UPI0006917B54|nr:EAL domain-containing protein [Myxosarcina sp. GI1]
MLNQSANSKSLALLREAFTSLLPIVLIMNILVLLSGLTGLLESWGINTASAINGNEINRLYFFLIPLFLNISLSILLAKEKDLDRIGTILISMVCFFRISGFLAIDESGQLFSYHSSILTSIPCTWFAVSLLHYFSKFSQFRFIKYQTDISPRLKKTVNLLIPGLLSVLCFEAVGQLLRMLLALAIIPLLTQAVPKFRQIGEIRELILYKTISLLTWFLGVHGEHSADGLFRLLKGVPSGEISSLRLKTFHDVFMNIGGSGATLVIPLLVLFSKRTTSFKSLARLSLPFSLFNVNEILLFGLPIILNPIFFIPFFVVPFVNMAIALIAVHFGVFAIAPVTIHWMSPPLYSAYISTNGSVWAVITQLLCMAIDGCIYYPFLVFASYQFKTPLHLLKLLGEDAYSFVNEEIERQEERLFATQQMAMLNSMTSAQQLLQQLRGGQFLLYFQPKVDAKTFKLVGLEALLRFQDATGKIRPPTFLPVLYQQGLSKAVDEKVVNLAFEYVLRWRAMGLLVPPISINFDKDFLLDSQAVRNFIARAKEQKICFYIEITEHTYTVELEALKSVTRQLREAGHLISIDDFGAGYSSLTSLLVLEADEIKLDRKLVVCPQDDEERGQILLASSIKLCHDLGFLVVAEGVETIAQLQIVRDCGADFIQGYYFGKPMNPDFVSDLFLKKKKRKKDRRQYNFKDN